MQVAQRAGGGAEQQLGKFSFVVAPQRDQVLGRGEGGVDMGAAQQAFLPAGQPLFAFQSGAQGAAAVVAGVVVGRAAWPLGQLRQWPPIAAVRQSRRRSAASRW